YNPTDNFEIESNLNGDIVTFNQTVLDDGAWHDAIITFDSMGIDTTTCTLYINGSLVSADSLFEDSLAISYMGAVATPTRQLDGSMWDVRIYSSILTATQIADYSVFKAIPTTNLIHRWVGSGDSCIVDNGWLDTVGSSEGTVSGSPTKRSYK
ncbi:MAG: LamG domain-containing protein, partial [Alphaproteobacteria bacterium]|nr:LamG domain-containing protein [Alphaproteobacteria bacterium]